MQKTKVFIIEDDPTMVGLLQTLLNLEGFLTESYQTKTHKLVTSQIIDYQPDMIFLDVHLRDLDGLELIQELKKDANLLSIPVVMTSGTDYRDICLKMGASNFILKPYMPDDLITIFKSLAVKE